MVAGQQVWVAVVRLPVVVLVWVGELLPPQ
jgi:hypothetical protein